MGFLKQFVKDNPSFISSSFIQPETDEDTTNSSISLREFFAGTDPDKLYDIQIEHENRYIQIVELDDPEVVVSTPNEYRDDTVILPAEVVESTPKKTHIEKNKTPHISHLIEILKEPVQQLDSVDYYCMSLAKDIKNKEPGEQWRIGLEITKIMCTAKFKD